MYLYLYTYTYMHTALLGMRLGAGEADTWHSDASTPWSLEAKARGAAMPAACARPKPAGLSPARGVHHMPLTTKTMIFAGSYYKALYIEMIGNLQKRWFW